MKDVAFMYSGNDRSWSHLLSFFDVPFASEHLPDSVPVYLVVNHHGHYPVGDAIPLPEFEHPARESYVFGDDKDEKPLVPPPGAVQVTIPTEYPLGLYASQAAAIVLYDRMVKINAD